MAIIKLYCKAVAAISESITGNCWLSSSRRVGSDPYSSVVELPGALVQPNTVF
jgi:hypothetical protein